MGVERAHVHKFMVCGQNIVFRTMGIQLSSLHLLHSHHLESPLAIIQQHLLTQRHKLYISTQPKQNRLCQKLRRKPNDQCKAPAMSQYTCIFSSLYPIHSQVAKVAGRLRRHGPERNPKCAVYVMFYAHAIYESLICDLNLRPSQM